MGDITYSNYKVHMTHLSYHLCSRNYNSLNTKHVQCNELGRNKERAPNFVKIIESERRIAKLTVTKYGISKYIQ